MRLPILLGWSVLLALACGGKPADTGGEENGGGESTRDETGEAGETGGDSAASDTSETGGDSGGGDTGEHSGGESGGGSTARTGLEGFCDYYIECGGSYYADAQDCIDESLAYWGECRRPELDAFGDCMLAEFTCDTWNPDTYNPSGGACGEEWAALRNADC